MSVAQVGEDSIYYVQQGEEGLPVVFVHGAGGSHLIWWNQVRALAPIARPIAMDLPGHGKSSPAGRNSVDAYRDVIAGFLDALGLDRAVVVGHSMGGAIAQAVALAHPDRLAGLVLVGTGARLRVLPAILDGVLNAFGQTAQIVTDYSFAPDADASLKRKSEEQFRLCPPQITHGDFSACNAFDILPRVGDIRVPTLIICGRQDQMTPPKYSEFLAAKIPNARLVLVEGAGHYVMIEQPEEVSRALTEFVTNLHVS